MDIAPRPSRERATQLLAAADLPTADLTDAHMAHFFFCGPPAAPTALVGFEIHGSDALLRSLVVVPELRTQGIGKRLVARAEREARACGARAIYLLTTTAEPFFARCGYEPADRAHAPEAIRATREFAEICPASSAFMTKTLLSPSGRVSTP